MKTTTDIIVELIACKHGAPEHTKKAIDAAVNEIERLELALKTAKQPHD